MSMINSEVKPFQGTAYQQGEFIQVTDQTLRGKWSVFFFYPADFTFVCPTELGDLAEHYSTFQALGVQVYGVSTDTHFTHKAWHDTSDTIGKITYPMIGDPSGTVTNNFGVMREGAGLADRATFKAYLEPLYDTHWHVYANRPFAGPEQVLAYLARYTHRVAISNKRLVGIDGKGVTFTFKDYRIEGPGRYKTMTVAPAEFIRRFMLHVLPKGFHRIRHYGLLATSRTKAATIERARELIRQVAPIKPPAKQEAPADAARTAAPDKPEHPCPSCGGQMVIIEIFEPGSTPRQRPSPPIAVRIDTS